MTFIIMFWKYLKSGLDPLDTETKTAIFWQQPVIQKKIEETKIDLSDIGAVL